MEMSSFLNNPPTNFLTISEAARSLDVSIKTLRRWEAFGIITPARNPLNHRLYNPRDLIKLEGRKNSPLPVSIQETSHVISISAAAEKIGVSIKTLRRWEKAGKITCQRNNYGQRVFSKSAVSQGMNLKALQDRLINPPPAKTVSFNRSIYTSSLLIAFTIGFVAQLILRQQINTTIQFTPNRLLDQTVAKLTLGNYVISFSETSATTDPITLAAAPPNQYLNRVAVTQTLFPEKPSPTDLDLSPSDSNSYYINNNQYNNKDILIDKNTSLPINKYNNRFLSPSPQPDNANTINAENLNLEVLESRQIPAPIIENTEPMHDPKGTLYLPTI